MTDLSRWRLSTTRRRLRPSARHLARDRSMPRWPPTYGSSRPPAPFAPRAVPLPGDQHRKGCPACGSLASHELRSGTRPSPRGGWLSQDGAAVTSPSVSMSRSQGDQWGWCPQVHRPRRRCKWRQGGCLGVPPTPLVLPPRYPGGGATIGRGARVPSHAPTSPDVLVLTVFSASASVLVAELVAVMHPACPRSNGKGGGSR
jgi:hypothetical protein